MIEIKEFLSLTILTFADLNTAKPVPLKVQLIEDIIYIRTFCRLIFSRISRKLKSISFCRDLTLEWVASHHSFHRSQTSVTYFGPQAPGWFNA